MKKRIYFLSMLAAGLAFASCTDDIDNVTSGENVAAGETGFVKIAINLPTTSGQSTRAGNHANDQFDDGLLNEYKVDNNDAYLLVFGGDDEDDATLGSWYKINTSFSNDPVSTNNNVTTTSEVIQAIEKPEGNKTFALVVLNNNSILGFSGNTGTSLTIGGTSVTTLTSLQEKLVKEVTAFLGSNKDAFTMTNAPIATKSGSGNTNITGQDVSTLVELELHATEEEAKDETADEIYVERVVAKVTVSANSSLFTKDDAKNKYYAAITDANGNYNGDKVYLEGWYLNITNKSTNFVRDVEDGTIPDWVDWAGYANSGTNTSDNRFFGYNAPYRVYWAIDHNYNKNWGDVASGAEETALKADFNIYQDGAGNPTMGSEGPDVFNADKPAYCLENTFVTSHMNQKETTAVVFKMTYDIDADGTAETFYIIGNSQEKKPTQTGGQLVEAINTELKGSFKVALKTEGITSGYYNTEQKIQSLFTKEDGDALSEDEAKKVLDAANGVIRVYKDGTTYYGIRIQHFGDTYTALATQGVADASKYDQEKHLGRYGVVRNNWYEINIASISGPGRPTPPDPTKPDDEGHNDPDDPEKNMWIKCNINILSWAKRMQDVNL